MPGKEFVFPYSMAPMDVAQSGHEMLSEQNLARRRQTARLGLDHGRTCFSAVNRPTVSVV